MSRILLAALSLLMTSMPVLAQEQEIARSNVPQNMADRLIAIVTDPETYHLEGDAAIPVDSVIPGNLVVMGSLRLAGTVEGELIVVGGDVELEPGSEIRGDLTVVGGGVRGEDAALVGGTLVAFGRPSTLVLGFAGGPASLDEPGIPGGVRRELDRRGSSFTVRGGSFNRIEGLPVVLGPAFSTGGPNPFRLEASLIWRSEGRAPFQTDRFGYEAQLEQGLLGRRELRFGGGVYSIIDPIESWGLTDRENSWSTLLFASDQRDYQERRGVRAFARVTPRALPVDASVELRHERLGSVASDDPWSAFNRARPWRDQPVVAEGSLRSLEARVDLDTRDDRQEPGHGWLIRASWEEGLGGTLAMPAVTLPSLDPNADPFPVAPPDLDARFSRAILDVRRYHSVGYGARLNLRGVVAGSPEGRALPPQRQHTLGGPGSLPGHRSFAADCGARDGVVSLAREGLERTMHPFYGCDRLALFQAEYRGSLGGFFGIGSPKRRGARSDHPEPLPRWVVFFDAGRAWAEGDWGAFPRSDSPTLYDAGLGVLVGGLGLYWAAPLGEESDGSRFIVRLDRRF